jgi:hypothetical protein
MLAGAEMAVSLTANRPIRRVGDVVVVIEEATAVSVRVPATSTAVPPLTAIMAEVRVVQLDPPVHTNESDPVATREYVRHGRKG